MRNFIKSLIIITIPFLANESCAQVGIGTTAPAGALDLNPAVATNFGFVAPRVALTSTILQAPVVNPQGGVITAGTVVYNTATAGTTPNNVGPGLYYWNGVKWIAFAGSPGGLDWSLTGNSGTTAGTNFIGTTDAQDIRFHTNGTERARILSGGTLGINSPGTTTSQMTVAAAGTNDAVGASANHNINNAFWGRNAHTTGTAIIGAANGLGGIYPTKGAGVAGSAVNGHGISGMTGNGSPDDSAHNGNTAGYFSLDTDNNPSTNNSSAFAFIAGKDEQSVGAIAVPSRRILYGGYFIGGTAAGGQSYSYVGLKYNHNNDATATGGTNYKVVGNGSNSTLILDEKREPRVLFSPEAPEILFQDFGIGKLVNGTTTIKLDPLLTKSIFVNDKHPLKVFIQLEGDCNGVYVTSKTAEGFTVKELNGGNSNVAFSWQIVASRADDKDENGNVTSSHVGLRFPYGPKPIAEPGFKTKEIKKEEAKN